MDTCSEILSHRDSLRVTRVVQVDLLGLADPFLMDRFIKPYEKPEEKPTFPKGSDKKQF
jgi:hypothetical protein